MSSVTHPALSRLVLTASLGLSLLLGACATGQPVVGASADREKTAPADAPNALLVPDIALPVGARLDAESSLLIGTGDRWLGRLVLKVDSPSVQVYNHFYNGMPSFGWALITAIQARTSILSFQRGDRVALVQIEPASLSGVVVTINVSPRQAAPQQDSAKRQ